METFEKSKFSQTSVDEVHMDSIFVKNLDPNSLTKIRS